MTDEHTETPPDLTVSEPPVPVDDGGHGYEGPSFADEIVSALQRAGLTPGSRIEANRVRVGAVEDYSLASGARPLRVLGPDPRRQRAVLIATGGAMRVYRNAGGQYVTWPAGVPLEITHSDAVWVAPDDGALVAGLLAESQE